MKLINYLIIIIVWIASCVVCYQTGYYKTYYAAGRMSDVIRCYEDHLNNPDSMDCKERFRGIEEVFLYDETLGPVINLKDYKYCY